MDKIAEDYKLTQGEIQRLRAMCAGIDSILDKLCEDDKHKVKKMKADYERTIERLMPEFNLGV